MTITDTGEWQTPDPHADPIRGRGMPLIHALIPHVSVTTSSAGTVVDLRTRFAE